MLLYPHYQLDFGSMPLADFIIEFLAVEGVSEAVENPEAHEEEASEGEDDEDRKE